MIGIWRGWNGVAQTISGNDLPNRGVGKWDCLLFGMTLGLARRKERIRMAR